MGTLGIPSQQTNEKQREDVIRNYFFLRVILKFITLIRFYSFALQVQTSPECFTSTVSLLYIWVRCFLGKHL